MAIVVVLAVVAVVLVVLISPLLLPGAILFALGMLAVRLVRLHGGAHRSL